MSSANPEPKTIASGSTIVWTKTLSSYPAGGAFTLGYKVVGSGGVKSAVVTAQGSDYSVTLTAADLPAGHYRLVGFITNSVNAKFTVYESDIEVTPNLIDATAPIDTRSYWQQLLEAIDAVMLNRASIIQKSMTTPGAGSRSIEYMDPDALIKWRKQCEYEIRKLDEKERVARGQSRRKILVQFS